MISTLGKSHRMARIQIHRPNRTYSVEDLSFWAKNGMHATLLRSHLVGCGVTALLTQPAGAAVSTAASQPSTSEKGGTISSGRPGSLGVACEQVHLPSVYRVELWSHRDGMRVTVTWRALFRLRYRAGRSVASPYKLLAEFPALGFLSRSCPLLDSTIQVE